jgi:hypothetical protein
VIEDNIRTYLLSQTPISNIVGTDAAGAMARIYSVDRQQSVTGDSIVYERVGSEREPMLASAQGSVGASIEFDCVSLTYARAKALAHALRGELDGFRGAMGDATVHWCSLEDEYDDFDPPADGSAKGQYHVIQTYHVQFLESIPTFA